MFNRFFDWLFKDVDGSDARPLINALDTEFGISGDYVKCSTLADVVQVVAEALGRSGSGEAVDRAILWERVRAVISCELGVVETDLTPELRLVEDLGY